MTIDINCDMGESRGNAIIGNDEALFPYITSCNIACGFHGGDPYHIQKTIESALNFGLKIGAHPSYPDLEGFGRKKMTLEADELKAIMTYQIAALKGMVESAGGKLEYVKPHGALYHKATANAKECTVIVEAMQAIDKDLALMGLANSEMKKVANKQGVYFIKEAFLDRKYLPNGQLLPRKEEGSVIHHPQEVLNQFVLLLNKQSVMASDGSEISIKADSFCVHGDNPAAVKLLKTIHDYLSTEK